MRLRILDSGHSFGTKALFAFIQMVSRQPVLDVVKVVSYRSDFYGKPMSRVTQEAMRGPSAWSVADRELMAAFIASTNSASFARRHILQSRNGPTETEDRFPLRCPISTPRRSRSRCERHYVCFVS